MDEKRVAVLEAKMDELIDAFNEARAELTELYEAHDEVCEAYEAASVKEVVDYVVGRVDELEGEDLL